MSQYHFAAHQGAVDAATVEARDRIAQDVGGTDCGYLSITDASGVQLSCGFCPNYGFPLDQRLSARIIEAWDGQGVGGAE